MRTLLLACILLVLLPAAAAAQGSRDLLATVNVCDTAAKPNTLGVRGSMPGLKRKATLRMRFRVQYLAPDSLWQTVGVRAGGRVESGWSFTFAPPKSGDVVLRGVVYFQWRRFGKVVRRARRITEDGHGST